MQVIVAESYEEMSRAAADRVAELVAAKPTASIIVPTGETPLGLYRALAERYRRGELETARLRIFQLDAYLGLAHDDRRSLWGWMKREFLDPLEIEAARVTRLPGDTPDPEAACRAYDAAVRAAGGIDRAILGLGPNGHLGFNEPPADPAAPTRVVDLTAETIESNARYWGGRDQVPRRALTAGMAVLLAARQTLLLVAGAHKREILRRAVVGPISPEVPASYLQQAQGVTVLADVAAWPGETVTVAGR